MVWYDMVWYGMVLYCVVLYCVVLCSASGGAAGREAAAAGHLYLDTCLCCVHSLPPSFPIFSPSLSIYVYQAIHLCVFIHMWGQQTFAPAGGMGRVPPVVIPFSCAVLAVILDKREPLA